MVSYKDKMILDGKKVAEKIYKEIGELKGVSLAVILVGEDNASLSFVKAKEKAAERLGANFKLYQLPLITPKENILSLINDLNFDKTIQGIVVQLPLPDGINPDEIVSCINTKKDIDGLQGGYPVPTVEAIIEIFNDYHINYKNKKILVIGKGRLVGKPLMEELGKEKIPFKNADSKTKDLASLVSRAEIIVTAAGVPSLIKREMVNDRQIIIDAGTSKIGGQFKGDLDEAAYGSVYAYTPVPGGVGPITVACLMRNLYKTIKI